MKINESGLYEVTEGEMFIEDIETGERMVFLLDQNSGIVIRSLTEQDIKPAISMLNTSSKDKRNKKRILWQEVPKKGSEEYIFVAEKIIGNNSDNLYEKDRKIIGFGAREEQSININVCADNESTKVLKLVTKLAEYYGIKGEPYFIPSK